VLEGGLGYSLPPAPFTSGTAGIGEIEAVGRGVRHLIPGQRMLLDPHLVVDERVPEPAQILIGLTATRSSGFGGVADAAAALQRDWPDGAFTERACMPASVVTPLPPALAAIPSQRMAGLSRFAVPYGGFLRRELQPGETVLVNGASGYFGSAAVALGASRVVALVREPPWTQLPRLPAHASPPWLRPATMQRTRKHWFRPQAAAPIWHWISSDARPAWRPHPPAFTRFAGPGGWL
jgi:alcohol dehydrogenase